MMRPASAPICTISHELDCCSSSPNTVWPRRSKTKYWPEADCWKPATSRKRPATWAGTARDDRMISGWMALRPTTRKQAPPSAQSTRRSIVALRSRRAPRSISGGIADGLQDIGRLRQDRFLEIGVVRHRRAARADAPDGRIQVLEELAGYPRSDLATKAAHQLILVRDHDTVRPLHLRGDGFPVVGHDRPKVQDGGADMILLGLLCREQRPLHEGAPRDDEHVIAFPSQARAAERNHEVFARVFALVVGLPVQVLVLEEQHRVVAPDGGPQEAGCIDRGRRIHNPDARAVREDAFARLAVIRAAAAEIAADRHADDHRARPGVPRSIPHHGHLVANLHHGGPDVVEELDLDHRFELSRGHPDGASDDAGFGER